MLEASAPDPRLNEDRNGTRARVLVEATRLFARKGVDACTMRDVAGATGIKAPALYNHFSSKEDILEEAMRFALTSFLRDVLGPLGEYPPDEWLSHLVRRHVMFQLEHSDLALSNDLLMARDRRDQGSPGVQSVRDLQREYFELVRDLVRGSTGLRASGRLNVVAFTIIGVCDWTNSWYRPGAGLTTKDVADETWANVQKLVSQ